MGAPVETGQSSAFHPQWHPISANIGSYSPTAQIDRSLTASVAVHISITDDQTFMGWMQHRRGLDDWAYIVENAPATQLRTLLTIFLLFFGGANVHTDRDHLQGGIAMLRKG